jgi:hypothetical protein
MKSERGFFLPPLGISTYAMIGMGLVIALMGAGLKIQTARLHSAQHELALVQAIGEQAQRAATAQAAADLRNKERSDDEAKRITAAHNAVVARLRDANARRSFVPAAPASSKRPELACFDRTELDGALRQFVANAIGLIGEGEQATIDLDVVKGWAKK